MTSFWIISVLILYSAGVSVYLWLNIKQLKESRRGFCNVNAAQDHLKVCREESEKALAEAQSQKVALMSEKNDLSSRVESLSNTLKKLKDELALAESNGDVIDFGLYTPAYNMPKYLDYQRALERNRDEQKKFLKDVTDSASKRVNQVNMRKEFFRVTLDEIERVSKSKGATTQFTRLAEAEEYRKSEMKRKSA